MEDKKLLVTGAAGFIGSNLVDYIFEEYRDPDITVVDKLTYAGDKKRLEPHLDEIEFHQEDIADYDTMEAIFREKEFDIVINLAAESHVDRSIKSGEPFVRSNVHGAYNLMEIARTVGIEKFLHISTDEVYGSVEEGKFTEGDSLNPSSPYSASKAAADMFIKSFKVTHDLPAIIARPTNNYGPKQHTEKLIPKFIKRAKKGKKLPLYGDGTNVRDWLYVKDTCRALDNILRKGEPGEIYNIGGDNFKKNIEVTKRILDLVGADENLIEFVEDRKGHDQRYAVDSSKIRELGWQPKTSFKEGLKRTAEYYPV